MLICDAIVKNVMASVAKWLRQWFVVPPFVGSIPIIRPFNFIVQTQTPVGCADASKLLYLWFVSKSRSPLAPLKKGGTRAISKSPLLSGDLGGSRLRKKRVDISKLYGVCARTLIFGI